MFVGVTSVGVNMPAWAIVAIIGGVVVVAIVAVTRSDKVRIKLPGPFGPNEIDGSRTAADITTGNVKAGGSAKIHARSLKTKDITAAQDVEITDGRGGDTPKA